MNPQTRVMVNAPVCIVWPGFQPSHAIDRGAVVVRWNGRRCDLMCNGIGVDEGYRPEFPLK
jgi:hypothetical protein